MYKSNSVAMLSIWLGSALFTVRIKLYILISYFRSYSYEVWCDSVIMITQSNIPYDILGALEYLTYVIFVCLRMQKFINNNRVCASAAHCNLPHYICMSSSKQYFGHSLHNVTYTYRQQYTVDFSELILYHIFMGKVLNMLDLVKSREGHVERHLSITVIIKG